MPTTQSNVLVLNGKLKRNQISALPFKITKKKDSREINDYSVTVLLKVIYFIYQDEKNNNDKITIAKIAELYAEHGNSEIIKEKFIIAALTKPLERLSKLGLIIKENPNAKYYRIVFDRDEIIDKFFSNLDIEHQDSESEWIMLGKWKAEEDYIRLKLHEAYKRFSQIAIAMTEENEKHISLFYKETSINFKQAIMLILVYRYAEHIRSIRFSFLSIVEHVKNEKNFQVYEDIFKYFNLNPNSFCDDDFSNIIFIHACISYDKKTQEITVLIGNNFLGNLLSESLIYYYEKAKEKYERNRSLLREKFEEHIIMTEKGEVNLESQPSENFNKRRNPSQFDFFKSNKNRGFSWQHVQKRRKPNNSYSMDFLLPLIYEIYKNRRIIDEFSIADYYLTDGNFDQMKILEWQRNLATLEITYGKRNQARARIKRSIATTMERLVSLGFITFLDSQKIKGGHSNILYKISLDSTQIIKKFFLNLNVELMNPLLKSEELLNKLYSIYEEFTRIAFNSAIGNEDQKTNRITFKIENHKDIIGFYILLKLMLLYRYTSSAKSLKINKDAFIEHVTINAVFYGDILSLLPENKSASAIFTAENDVRFINVDDNNNYELLLENEILENLLGTNIYNNFLTMKNYPAVSTSITGGECSTAETFAASVISSFKEPSEKRDSSIKNLLNY